MSTELNSNDPTINDPNTNINTNAHVFVPVKLGVLTSSRDDQTPPLRVLPDSTEVVVPFIFKRYHTSPRAMRGPKLSRTIIWLGASKTTRSRSRCPTRPRGPTMIIASD